jgi:hypothetical protein
MMAMLLPSVRGVQDERKARAAEKRAAEALLEGQQPDTPPDVPDADEVKIEVDASHTASAEEKL